MCTASWLSAGGDFFLLFNRDERRTRAKGLPPQRSVAGDTRYLAPLDPESGGTWIAVNERGLVLALLNRSEDGHAPQAGTMSRGTVIPALIGNRDPEVAIQRLQELDLKECGPFRLLAQRGDEQVLVASWNGSQLASQGLKTAAGLLCSSSLGDERVTRARTSTWRRLRSSAPHWTVDELRALHRSHDPEPSADSVCMHRDDAETVSQVEIHVSGAAIELAFRDGPPCRGGAVAIDRLSRAD